MKTRLIAAVVAATAALSFSAATQAADQTDTKSYKVGKIEKANELIGRNVINQQDEKIGDIADFVVDLESGRILYTLVSSGGFLGVGDTLSAVPPGMFRAAEGGNRFVLNVDKQKLRDAPKFTTERGENLADAAFVREVHSYYQQPAAWIGTGGQAKLGNVHRASKLLKMEVKNTRDEAIGSVQNLAADRSAQRVLYVILDPARTLDEGAGFHYALPPMALTASTDKGTLVANLDKTKVSSAPRFKPGNWEEITAPAYAENVYRFYGKQLYTEGELISPTGREDLRQNTRPPSEIRGDDADRDNRDNNRRNRNRERQEQRRSERREGRAATAATTAAAGDNAYGPIIGAESLMGWEVQAAGGKKLGTLTDLIVDLESGRLLYGVIDEKGLGARDNHAVAPGAFRNVRESDKLIIAEFGERKLADAPTVPRARNEFAAPSFVENVYRFYGEQPWWMDRSPTPTGREGTGKFGNVHRASDLSGMNVENASGENLGKVHNTMVDLPDGRVAFVLLAPKGAGRDEFVVLPPMALTLNSEGRSLVTNLDTDKLASAPKVARNQLNKLDDASFASEVYRYYGKDTWWSGGTSPTGRE
jgi:sporulation protein YlmC with PRC-barrel domain